MRAMVYESQCTVCGACVGLCPTEAITIRGGVAKIMGPFCKGCNLCVEGCGEDAIRILE